MYYKGIMTVDPKELTKIKIEKPSGAFKSMFYSITGGKVGDKKEIETFTAISIIQQIYDTFLQLGVSNVIRINHDNLDIYYDRKGQKDDFSLAFDTYSIEIDDSMSAYFDRLWVVMEHEDEIFKYLIELSINRNHCVNEYPIEIIVNGLLKQTEGTETKSDLKNNLKSTFKSQKQYNEYISSKQIDFNSFLSKLNFELRKQIRVDDIKQTVKTRLLIQRGDDEKKIKNQKPKYGDPPYFYYGFDDFLFSSILWSDLIFDLGLNVANVELIDEAGSHLLDIGESGVVAEAGSIFDSTVDLDFAISSVGADGIIESVNLSGAADSIGSVVESSGGWFDSILDNIDIP